MNNTYPKFILALLLQEIVTYNINQWVFKINLSFTKILNHKSVVYIHGVHEINQRVHSNLKFIQSKDRSYFTTKFLVVFSFHHKIFIFKICWGRGEYTNFSWTSYHIADLSICISHTSSILLLTIGLSGSPQAALSSEPRLTTASSSSCSPSISSLAAYKEKKSQQC